MNRRDFITLLGRAAAWPLAAHAQQAPLPVIGFLGGASASSAARERMRANLAGFFQGLADQGYIEHRTFSVEYRWAEDQYDRLPELAADLVRSHVSVLFVAASTPGALAAKAATQTIPVVYLVGTDPVEVGLAASLARPGGNLTGITIIGVELMSKCLQLMHDLAPAATTLAVLVNPANAVQAETETRDVQAAALRLGLRLVILHASSASEIDAAFATLLDERAGGLVVSGEYFFSAHADQLVALAARHVVPTIYQYRNFTIAGGLMNYGPNVASAYRIVGGYVGRILKGEKAADLPVQQVTRMELVVNMKTAKALGIAVSPTFLALADEVIE
jgi:putative tryptophan/tyrosine transport system substrate-binding protein